MNKDLNEIILNLSNNINEINSQFKLITKNKYKLFFNNFKENIENTRPSELIAQVKFLQFITEYHKVDIKNLNKFVQDMNKLILEISIYNKLTR